MPIDPKDCKHPIERRYAWYARDDSVRRKRKNMGAGDREVLCIACCDCGTVLEGGVTLDSDEQDDERKRD